MSDRSHTELPGLDKHGYDVALNYMRKAMSTIGLPIDSASMRDTPHRVLKAWWELTESMRVPEQTFLSTIAREFSTGYDEMVTVQDIPFTTLCEHHMLPFIGHATVGYVPGEVDSGNPGVHHVPTYRVLGLSKLARIVQYYASQPQLQERLTTQVARALQDVVDPRGVGVQLRAEHTCMSCRGPRSLGTTTVTTALLGVMREQPEARAEFLQVCSRGKLA